MSILMLSDSIQNFHIALLLSFLNDPLHKALFGVYLVMLFFVYLISELCRLTKDFWLKFNLE